MVNFKKMDEKDFVFINKPINPEEEKAFSDFLKARKGLGKRKRNSLTPMPQGIKL